MTTEVIIIEDEPQAADRLERLLNKIAPNMKVMARIESVKDSVIWLKGNPPPSLIFMDIQLADGISFDVFKQVEVTCPVIFTTAYDEYALKAFKVNSIDYLLKPIDEDELRIAVNKYLKVSISGARMLESISHAVELITKKYKTRFIVKVGEKLKSIEIQEIDFFFSFDKITFARTTDGRKHVVDFTLDQLDGVLDPNHFFRINRKYIVSVRSIQDMISHTNSRIKLILKKNDDDDVIVARERVQEFKEWLDK